MDIPSNQDNITNSQFDIQSNLIFDVPHSPLTNNSVLENDSKNTNLLYKNDFEQINNDPHQIDLINSSDLFDEGEAFKTGLKIDHKQRFSNKIKRSFTLPNQNNNINKNCASLFVYDFAKCSQRSSSIKVPSKTAAQSFLSTFYTPVQKSCTLEDTYANDDSNNTGSEIKKIGDYFLGKNIGTGTFSMVKEAYKYEENTHNTVLDAVKIIQKSELTLEETKYIENEIQLWKLVQHKNIVRLKEIHETDEAYYIFMEYCEKGTLLNLIQTKKHLDEDTTRFYFKQIVNAISYLHNELQISHHDIKLENILLTKNNVIKLTDFGLSELNNNEVSLCKMEACRGSVPYCSPERLRGDKASCPYAHDVWSLGIILYAMCTGRMPFSDNFEPRLMKKIMIGSFELPSKLSQSLLDLIQKMLCVEPENRLKINQIMEHTWTLGNNGVSK